MLCKSVTLDDCTFNEDLVIERKFTPTAIICQSSCLLYADCNTFSFNGTKTQDNCVLLTYDYRQSCKVNAGLEVGFKFNSQMCQSLRKVKIRYGYFQVFVIIIFWCSVEYGFGRLSDEFRRNVRSDNGRRLWILGTKDALFKRLYGKMH